MPPADWETKREWHAYAYEQLRAAGYETSSAYTMVKTNNSCDFVYRSSLWQGADMVALGVSSFGHMSGVHVQNTPHWNEYFEAIGKRELPLSRAFATTSDERLTREMILQLKLGEIHPSYFNDKFGVDTSGALRRLVPYLAQPRNAGNRRRQRPSHDQRIAARRLAAPRVLCTRVSARTLHLENDGPPRVKETRVFKLLRILIIGMLGLAIALPAVAQDPAAPQQTQSAQNSTGPAPQSSGQQPRRGRTQDFIYIEGSLPYVPTSNTIAAKLPLSLQLTHVQRRHRDTGAVRGAVRRDHARRPGQREQRQRAARQRRARLLSDSRLRFTVERPGDDRRRCRAGSDVLRAVQRRERRGAQGSERFPVRQQPALRHRKPGA